MEETICPVAQSWEGAMRKEEGDDGD